MAASAAKSVRSRKVIEEHKQAKLTADKSIGFVQALLAPAAPNEALRTTFKRYCGEVNASA